MQCKSAAREKGAVLFAVNPGATADADSNPLGCGIAEVVEDIKAGRMDDPLKAINPDGYVFSDAYDAGIKDTILGRKVGDFTKWKDHDAFEAALEELVQALRADDGRREPPPKPKL
jgi:hypothetical protein